MEDLDSNKDKKAYSYSINDGSSKDKNMNSPISQFDLKNRPIRRKKSNRWFLLLRKYCLVFCETKLENYLLYRL